MKKFIIGFFVFIIVVGSIRACFGNKAESNVSNSIEEKVVEKPDTYDTALICLLNDDYNKAAIIYNDLRFKNKNDVKLPILKEKFNTQLKDSISITNKKINSLKSSIYSQTDDFEKITWFKPKFEKSNFETNVYLYFGKSESEINSPRIVIRYFGDTWVFWNKVNFLIDGENIEYIPIDTPNKENSDTVWEKSDESITSDDLIMIDKMNKAKSVKFRFVGTEHVRDFVLSKNRINDLKNVLNYHDLMKEQQRLSKISFLN
jgi:hypothetical protein